MDERSSEEMHNNVHDLGEAKKMFHLLRVLDGKREKEKGKKKWVVNGMKPIASHKVR